MTTYRLLMAVLCLMLITACGSVERDRQAVELARQNALPIYVVAFDSYVSPASAQQSRELNALLDAAAVAEQAEADENAPATMQASETADPQMLGVYIRLQNLQSKTISSVDFVAQAYDADYQLLTETVVNAAGESEAQPLQLSFSLEQSIAADDFNQQMFGQVVRLSDRSDIFCLRLSQLDLNYADGGRESLEPTDVVADSQLARCRPVLNHSWL